MFTYLIALAAILLIIFGLLRAKRLNNWVQSSINSSLTNYNGATHRPLVEASLPIENLDNNSTPEKFLSVTNESVEDDNVLAQKLSFTNKGRLSDPFLEEPGIKLKDWNVPQHSFEEVSSDDLNKNLDSYVTSTLQVRETKNDTFNTSKQNGIEKNISESLKSSSERPTINPTVRLNTRQIYNLILKETMKENETKQKLIDNFKGGFTESSVETNDHLPSSSKNRSKHENNKS